MPLGRKERDFFLKKEAKTFAILRAWKSARRANVKKFFGFFSRKNCFL
jgi:hypothetical protein